MENRILNDVIEARNGHYCHCLELDSAASYEGLIESFIDNEGDKYTEEEYIEFFSSITVYYLPFDGEQENKEDEQELYNFNSSDYIRGTL